MNLTQWKRQAAARDLTPNEVIHIIDAAQKETWELRAALSFIANHEAPEGSALETVVRFARMAIGVKE